MRFLGFLLILLLSVGSASAVLIDDFGRADSGTVGTSNISTTWNEFTESAGTMSISSYTLMFDEGAVSNQLRVDLNITAYENPSRVDFQAMWDSACDSSTEQTYFLLGNQVSDGDFSNQAIRIIWCYSAGAGAESYSPGLTAFDKPFIYNASQWYNISIRNVDYGSDVYDIYIDNTLYSTDVAFTGDYSGEVIRFDDVSENNAFYVDCVTTEGTTCIAPPPVTEANFTVIFKDGTSGATIENATLNMRKTGSGASYYPLSTTSGTLVTNISNSDGNNYDLVGSTAQISPWGRGYLVNITNNFDVSSNTTMYFARLKPLFSIINVTKNNTGELVNTYSANVCGSVYSTTNGSVTTAYTFDSGLCNITIYGITGYYNRTYTNWNVSTNLTGLVYAVIEPPASETPTLDHEELLLFIFLCVVIGFLAFGARAFDSGVLGGVAFIGSLVLLFAVLTGDYFTSFEPFRSLLSVILTLFVLAVAFFSFTD